MWYILGTFIITGKEIKVSASPCLSSGHYSLTENQEVGCVCERERQRGRERQKRGERERQ